MKPKTLRVSARSFITARVRSGSYPFVERDEPQLASIHAPSLVGRRERQVDARLHAAAQLLGRAGETARSCRR